MVTSIYSMFLNVIGTPTVQPYPCAPEMYSIEPLSMQDMALTPIVYVTENVAAQQVHVEAARKGRTYRSPPTCHSGTHLFTDAGLERGGSRAMPPMVCSVGVLQVCVAG